MGLVIELKGGQARVAIEEELMGLEISKELEGLEELRLKMRKGVVEVG